MALFLIFVGIVLLVASVRDTQSTLFDLIVSEFTGTPNFLPWIIAIVLVGSLGFWKPVQKASVMFLALILISIFLRKGTGFFAQLSAFDANPSTSSTVQTISSNSSVS